MGEKYWKLRCVNTYYLNVYNKYTNQRDFTFLYVNPSYNLIFSFILNNYFKFYKKAKLPSMPSKYILNRFYYLKQLKNSFFKKKNSFFCGGQIFKVRNFCL